jgi:tetratricopeptide (TPR) repeat protein
MDTPPAESENNVNNLWLLPLLLLGVGLSLMVAFWFSIAPILDKGPGANPPPPTPTQPIITKLSRDDSLKLIELRNQAIGYLENHEFAAADAALTEVIRLIPADPFGPRNLAICRQLDFETIDKNRDLDRFTRAAVKVNEAIDLAMATDPSSFIPWVIASRVASKNERTEEALKNLREAIKLNPDSVGAAYDLFALLQATSTDQTNDEGFNALRSVYQKEANNLFVIKDWLLLLAQRRDSNFVETLTSVRETVSPFFETIKVNTRVDLNEIIQKALDAARDGNWPVAQRAMMTTRNLIVSEAARDKRFVILDSLEYVLPDFGEEFLARADLPDPVSPSSNPVHFLPSAESAAWPRSVGCRDVSVVDINLDGRSDLLVLQDDQIIAWERGEGTQTGRILAHSSTGGGYSGLLAYDFDDDVDHELKKIPTDAQPADALKHEHYVRGLCHTADPDVLLFGPSGLKLIENAKENKSSDVRTFVARSAGSAFDEVRNVVCVAVADIDNDGDLDLAASTTSGLRIFSNRGNLTFDETTSRSILPSADVAITALAIVDWDQDADIDLFVATTSGAGWLENVRHGRLRYRSLDDFNELRGSTSLRISDFDGDLSWDIAAAGPRGVNIISTNRTPGGLVSLRQVTKISANATRSLNVGDFDNDGTTDVIVLDTRGTTIVRNDGNCRFTPSPGAEAEWLKGASSLIVNDVDRDGDLDLVTIDQGGIAYLSSQCCETDNPHNGWIEVRLVADQVRPGEQNSDKRTNHLNIGGKVELKSQQKYQAKMVTDPVSHFGLGPKQRAEIVRILWTNGIPMNRISPALDEPVCIEQKLVGSCPYLYTWNGERFEFVTDLLWNAPLGLKFAENVIAPWREWEYIKIDGAQLKALENEYALRVTAELWEAEYFDQFKLFAIDHPAGTEIFTNEKVGPATLATPRIHTVQNPRRPVAAQDTYGRDVLDQVIARDNNYTKTFERRLAQGLTEEHFLELDLGDFEDAKNVSLFLTGWMYPGSTSLRVQHSQNPDSPPQRPPALYAPDATGEWREVRSFMGFPGGKTKTIAVDVSDLFSGNDHRLRIVSTMELYWDSAFFTVDEPPVDVLQTELALIRAELVDRGGVSQRSWPTSGNGPDQFDYSQLVPGEAWPTMSGNFTRFGDVLSLLTVRDDQLVVTGSGDEIRLAFAEPTTPLRDGWVRDFVLFSVGWDKDADPNTVYGDTVEPLPFEGMTVYAHRDGEPRPVDPGYAQYLRDYQTRQRNPAGFLKRIKQWKFSVEPGRSFE